ncbi:MAG: TIGR00725 family protein [Candidatus Anammoxibacter sp.]
MTRKICISVVGANDATPDDAMIAEEVGREIARNKAVLICGGLGGVMFSAAKGAKAEGGLTIGILPDNNPNNANPYIDVPIVTGLGLARNVIVAYSGDAVIAVGGKLGTLSEIAFSLIQDKPVIGINTWDLEEDRTYGKKIIVAENAKDAVKKAFELIK